MANRVALARQLGFKLKVSMTQTKRDPVGAFVLNIMSFIEPLRSGTGEGLGFTEARQMNADVIVPVCLFSPDNR